MRGERGECMPTEKPRIMVTVDEEMLGRIEHYRYLNEHTSLSKASTELLLKGLMRESADTSQTRVFSGDVMKLVNIFNKTDESGRIEILNAAVRANAKVARRSRTKNGANEDQDGALLIEDIQNLLTLYQKADARTRMHAMEILSNSVLGNELAEE